MSILNAVARAYAVAKERNWDKVYWCIDLHGTVLKANYSSTSFSFISEEVIESLRVISRMPESRIILWSAIYEDDEDEILRLFKKHGIIVHYVNENPEEESTATGNFDRKFYFSILVDDKAGFNPSDWPVVAQTAIAHSHMLAKQ